MDKRVTPPKRVTSPTWGPPSPCKQALLAFLDRLRMDKRNINALVQLIGRSLH